MSDDEREEGFYWIRDSLARPPRWEPAEWHSTGWFIIGSEIAICTQEDMESLTVGARIEAPHE